MKLKHLFIGLGILLLSAVIGSSLAVYGLRAKVAKREFAIQNGCWRVNPQLDLEEPYQRSLVALIGLFALRESEVLYFVASEDSEGNPLSSDYDYVIEGLDLDARYWSYTLYGADFFLVKNEAQRFGFNMDNIQYDEVEVNPELPKNAKQTYAIGISSSAKSTNWLPSGQEEQFHINLRMYNPSPNVYENLKTAALPTIKRIAK